MVARNPKGLRYTCIACLFLFRIKTDTRTTKYCEWHAVSPLGVAQCYQNMTHANTNSQLSVSRSILPNYRHLQLTTSKWNASCRVHNDYCGTEEKLHKKRRQLCQHNVMAGTYHENTRFKSRTGSQSHRLWYVCTGWHTIANATLENKPGQRLSDVCSFRLKGTATWNRLTL